MPRVVAASVRSSPRDARFRVTWQPAAQLRLMIDAGDGSKYLNDVHPVIELSAAADSIAVVRSVDIPHTGPGRYELVLSAPRIATFASVRVGGHVVDRTAVAGRYAPEFDAIGNDQNAMQRLAQASGGQVIPPRQIWPIDFRWPKRIMPLSSYLAVAGSLFVIIGLAWWKVTA